MIWITGDTHGDLARFQTKAARRLRSGDSLIVCGDFGFVWDGSAKEKKALKWLQKRKYNILFLDGKHENYDLLREFPEIEAFGGKVQHLGGSVYHLLRGEIYELEGKQIFAFGGGESSEKEFRREQDRFWDDEMPTAAEMERAVNSLNRCGRRVDYIITHEAPVAAKGLHNNRVDSVSTLETFFDETARHVEFSCWYFGSIHQNKRISTRYHALFDDIVPADGQK
ncbi:MAG: metallophosphoesterase [Firmicutes bacterium]|nr:metallophosphoesterase [Bacillota bacterium]